MTGHECGTGVSILVDTFKMESKIKVSYVVTYIFG